MVRVAILNADTPIAGEVIRLLVHHPETELVSLLSLKNIGRPVNLVHHGFIGEQNMLFSDKINIEDIDLLIIPEESTLAENIILNNTNNEDLKIISLLQKSIPEGWELGLSEVNRKALVRGAKRALIPSPSVASILIALIPLAKFLLLNSDIDIEVTLPQEIRNSLNENQEAEIIRESINLTQTSFRGKINLKLTGDNNERSAKSRIIIKNFLPIEEIERIYEEIYDDHNFTFLTNIEISSKEVEGTHKNIIRLNKPDADTLEINTFFDARMRGGAGEIVHVLNLFFGLHEKTGLDLKPSRF